MGVIEGPIGARDDKIKDLAISGPFFIRRRTGIRRVTFCIRRLILTMIFGRQRTRV